MNTSLVRFRAALAATVCVSASLVTAFCCPAWGAGLKTVVFNVEGVDLPKTKVLAARLADAGVLARKVLEDKGFAIVDTTPQAKVIAEKSPLRDCNGCDQDIAKALGAQLEVTLAVQQISTVTYNLSGNVKDVASNRVLRQGVVDIRGEGTDEWNHGVRFLIKDRLLDPPLPTDEAGLSAMVKADESASGEAPK